MQLKAREIVADVDMNDYPFIALHLEIKHKIWTSDDRLKGRTYKERLCSFFYFNKRSNSPNLQKEYLLK